jgi:hypothetical protein
MKFPLPRWLNQLFADAKPRKAPEPSETHSGTIVDIRRRSSGRVYATVDCRPRIQEQVLFLLSPRAKSPWREDCRAEVDDRVSLSDIFKHKNGNLYAYWVRKESSPPS